MNKKTVILALLALPLLATFASGQNLFRTGRPDYTRDYAATYHDRYAANRFLPLTSQYGQRYPSNFDSTLQNNLEKEQLQIARENLRREASQYQARYGNPNASDYNASRYSPSRFSSVAPVGYESESTRCRRCTSAPANGNDDGLTQPNARPSSYYRNPDDYENRSSNIDQSGYGNREFTSTDWRRTATRPFTSLLDSLFGTNR